MKPSLRLASLCALTLGLSLLACDGTALPIELPRSVSLCALVSGSCCAGVAILAIIGGILGRGDSEGKCPKCGTRLETVRYIEDPDMYRHEIHHAVICPQCDSRPEHELPWWIR
jgi:hypothetical protein